MAGGRGRQARQRARSGCAKLPSASITSTPISAAGSTACRCRAGSAPRRPASSKRSGPGVAGLQAGRSRRLCGRADRRLCRGADHARRSPGADSRRHQRPRGRGDDAEGHDRLVSGAPHAPGEARRDDPVPCGGRRRRADCLPMGEASRRDGDRHRRRRREGGAGPQERLRPSDRLPARGFCRPRQ